MRELTNILSIFAGLVADIFSSQLLRDAPFVDGFHAFVAGFLSLPVTAGFFFSAILIVLLTVIMMPLKFALGLSEEFAMFLPAAGLLIIMAVLCRKYLMPFFVRISYWNSPVIPLMALPCMKRKSVGMKSKGLGAIINEGLQTPTGFVINGAVFGRWVRRSRLVDEIESFRLSDDAAGGFKRLLLERPLPRKVKRAIKRELKYFKNEELIARSSFLDEDGLRTSMAGVYKSVSAKSELDSVIDAITEVWASYFSLTAEHARRNNGIDPGYYSLPVIVQKKIRSEVSIIASSVNALNGHTEEALIDYETITGKAGVAAYSYLTNGIFVAAEPVDLPFETDITVEIVAALRRLEARFGTPVQIEAGLKGGALYFFQARPLTAFEGVETFVNSFVIDIIDRPLTPFSESLFNLPDSVRNKLAARLRRFGDSGAEELIVRRNGRYYLRYNLIRNYLNPYYLSAAKFSVGAFAENLYVAMKAILIKRDRMNALKLRAELLKTNNSVLKVLRDEYALPLFNMQMDMFYLVDALEKRIRKYLTSIFGEGHNVEREMELILGQERETPYRKLLRAAACLAHDNPEQIEKFREEFGHWSEFEAEAGEPRLAEEPEKWACAAAAQNGAVSIVNKKDAHGEISSQFDERWKGYPINIGKLAHKLLCSRYKNAFMAREDVRETLNLAVSRARVAALESARDDSVFFATIDEIEGEYPERGVIEKRKHEYEEGLKSVGAAVAHEPEDEAAGEEHSDVICCMGIGKKTVEGVALVDEILKKNSGDEKPILVIPRPDPAYGIMIGHISALIIERGSPLSHLAILAMEAEIPVFVGAAGACSKARTGDRLLLDPRKGTIRIER